MNMRDFRREHEIGLFVSIFMDHLLLCCKPMTMSSPLQVNMNRIQDSLLRVP